jgi:hypothetical protein
MYTGNDEREIAREINNRQRMLMRLQCNVLSTKVSVKMRAHAEREVNTLQQEISGLMFRLINRV